MNFHSASVKIMISARDPSSAKSLIVVLKKMILDRNFDLHIILQEPAYSLVKMSKTIVRKSSLFQKVVASNIEKVCFNIITKVKPNIILTGISGPDFGIDEVLLKIADHLKIPSYSLQSYWGQINNSLGKLPKNIFVIDLFSKKETKKKCTSNLIISGTPFYETYNNLSIEKIFQEHKEKVTYKEYVLKIGLYAQPFYKIPGYKKTIISFVEEISKITLKTVIYYRPHPKETKIQTKWAISKLKESGHKIKIDHMKLEKSLIFNDAVVSCSSMCGYDLQQMNVRSNIPLGLPIFLMYNKEFFSWYKKFSGLNIVPMVQKKCGVIIKEKDRINSLILEAKREEIKFKFWKNMKSNIDIKSQSSDIILNSLKAEFFR